MNPHHRNQVPTILGVIGVLAVCVIVAMLFRMAFPNYQPPDWNRNRPHLGRAVEIEPGAPTVLEKYRERKE